MKFTGERVVFGDMKSSIGDYDNLLRHLQRYVYAMQFVRNKTVIDAACGTCYGSWLLSLGAKQILCVDVDTESLEYGKQLPFQCDVHMERKDLETETLPAADVCVSFETIEHLKDGFFLQNLRVKELIFSFPLKAPSPFHKIVFESVESGLAYLLDCGWATTEHFAQRNEFGEDKYIFGRAVR